MNNSVRSLTSQAEPFSKETQLRRKLDSSLSEAFPCDFAKLLKFKMWAHDKISVIDEDGPVYRNDPRYIEHRYRCLLRNLNTLITEFNNQYIGE